MDGPGGTRPPREWLLADGAGGFAMGPESGAPFRRYHAWLIAAADPPLRRTVMVRGAAEWWEPAGAEARDPRVFASCHAFEGDEARRPDGVATESMRRHRDGRGVTWDVTLPACSVRRTLRLAEGAVRVTWAITPIEARGDRDPGVWCVRPFTPLGQFHGLIHEGSDAPRVEPIDGGLLLRRADLAVELVVESTAGGSGGGMRHDPQWWNRFALSAEAARGQDSVGDEWSPGVVEVPIAERGTTTVELTARIVEPWLARSVPAAPPPAGAAPVVGEAPEPGITERLDAAASVFVVRRGAGRSIIAGYPWFADWGRDAMISLPGLLPPGERDDDAVSVLAALAAHRRDGLLPNCFHDESGANDHAADTGPWFLRTVAGYAAAPGGVDRVDAAGLFDAAADIIDAVVRGTRHGIRLDSDGLVTAGEPGGPAVTWMDAMRDGIAFTPRHGKAVEINALWIEGLLALSEVDPSADRRRRYDELGRRAAEVFARRFAWEERGCLVDRIASRDPADIGSPVDQPVHELRPNQLIAAGCPRVPLDRSVRASIVAACRSSLLTPFGLRTLDPGDRAYIGRYEGDLRQRDAAYHQGTVWPWLFGPLVDAMFLASDPADHRAVAETVRSDLETILASLDDGCVGQLAEIYDGDVPHRADGCPAQAWSVAEVRRVVRRLEAL